MFRWSMDNLTNNTLSEQRLETKQVGIEPYTEYGNDDLMQRTAKTGMRMYANNNFRLQSGLLYLLHVGLGVSAWVHNHGDDAIVMGENKQEARHELSWMKIYTKDA